jgi:hypothetical protein
MPSYPRTLEVYENVPIIDETVRGNARFTLLVSDAVKDDGGRYEVASRCLPVGRF